MPPETIKDSMMQGIQMPGVFIVPSKRYSRQFFINVAEFEFPAYFNFFIKKMKIRLVCDEEQERNIRIIFQETLLGPKEFPNIEDEFSESLPKGYMPDFPKELGQMATSPVTGKKLVLETLIDIVLFDKDGNADLGQGTAVAHVRR